MIVKMIAPRNATGEVGAKTLMRFSTPATIATHPTVRDKAPASTIAHPARSNEPPVDVGVPSRGSRPCRAILTEKPTEQQENYVLEPITLATVTLVVLGAAASLGVVGYWMLSALGW